MPDGHPWVFCGRQEEHLGHGATCPGTGLCANKHDHRQHLVLSGSLAPFWCLADQSLRQPWKGELEQRRRQNARLMSEYYGVTVRVDPQSGEAEVVDDLTDTQLKRLIRLAQVAAPPRFEDVDLDAWIERQTGAGP